MKRHFVIVGIVTSLFACGGGGGGGGAPTPAASASANSNAAAATTYSYDRVNGTYTNKLWDSVSVARFIDNDQEYFVDYSTDSAVALTESTNSVDVDITATKEGDGTSINYDWPVSVSNTTITNLYSTDDPNLIIAQSGVQNFANADIGILTYDLDYLAGKNISYADLAFVDVLWSSGTRLDSYVVGYGDATASGDLPTTGSKIYDLEINMLLEVWSDGETSIRALSEGTARLTANFGTNTVTGSIVITDYFDWDLWRRGGADSSRIVGVDPLTISISDGSISSGNYSASLSIDQTDTDDGSQIVGSGTLLGSFFGPDADETAASFLTGMDSDNDSTGNYYWDTFGGGIGN